MHHRFKNVHRNLESNVIQCHIHVNGKCKNYYKLYPWQIGKTTPEKLKQCMQWWSKNKYFLIKGFLWLDKTSYWSTTTNIPKEDKTLTTFFLLRFVIFGWFSWSNHIKFPSQGHFTQRLLVENSGHVFEHIEHSRIVFTRYFVHSW